VRRLGLTPSLSATLLAKESEVNGELGSGDGSSGGAREIEIFGMTEFMVGIKSECNKQIKMGDLHQCDMKEHPK